ncbi:MAG: hypothetical protein GTO71_12740 [Woeseiaceae bacterium]|nr:hypothetical protein [Woeseiaceae bacterium]NIP21934.1 hypothetical protein [Woeseiaceae bacterium]NIS91019.1 hypothetical protein [Woeseiaceae bacterium]
MRLSAILSLVVMLVACDAARGPVTLHPADRPPERLSDWGIVFADGKTFELNADVVPYDLNTPLFSDYALKMRTVWMPPGMSASYMAEGVLDFPVGTIISKTFHYEKSGHQKNGSLTVVKADRESALNEDAELDLSDYVLIETRLLVHYEDGWTALPYVWNETQTDASLEIAGDDRQLGLVAGTDTLDIVYVVPDKNQCGGCHVTDHGAKDLQPIGPKAWQLNRDYSWWGNDATQLENWSGRGLLRGFDGDAPAGVRWSPPGQATLEQRVRAYLDVNCAHCHNPAGAADTSALHLNLDAPVDRLYGICKTPVAVGRGSGDRPFDIYPGRPQDSILVYRMQHSDPAIAMPELGRSAVHTEGVTAVSDWIAALNGDCR